MSGLKSEKNKNIDTRRKLCYYNKKKCVVQRKNVISL